MLQSYLRAAPGWTHTDAYSFAPDDCSLDRMKSLWLHWSRAQKGWQEAARSQQKQGCQLGAKSLRSFVANIHFRYCLLTYIRRTSYKVAVVSVTSSEEWEKIMGTRSPSPIHHHHKSQQHHKPRIKLASNNQANSSSCITTSNHNQPLHHLDLH